MHTQGLKRKISFTFFILLAIGMLLVNLVVSAFWQRDIVTSRINNEKEILHIWDHFSQGSRFNLSSIDALREMHHTGGQRYTNIAGYDGQTVTFAANMAESSKLAEAVRLAAHSRRDVVQLYSTNWGFIFPTQSHAVIAVYIHPGKAVGVVVSLQSIYQMIGAGQDIIWVYILVNTLILTAIGLFRMMNLIVRPVQKLIMISESYVGNETDVLFHVKTGSEFGKLAMSLNSMLTRIKQDRQKLRLAVSSLEQANSQLRTTQKEMIIAEKMAAVGLLSAGIAHEIGNPLSIVHGYVEMLADRELPDDEAQQFSQRAIAELDRVSILIRQLLNFAHSSEKNNTPASLRTILSESLDIVKMKKCRKEILYSTNIHCDREISIADSSGLRQVILNCLLNAVDAIHENDDQQNGTIALSCNLSSQRESPAKISLSIKDDGVGMSASQVMSAFDPFFTTKEQGKGTGLGLFVSYALVEAAKGKIWLESSQGQGTTVYIELPLLAESVANIE